MIDSIAKPLTLLCDNEVVVFFSKNNKSSGAFKWINIKYLVVRDKVKNGTIVIQHINTRAMLADFLTKALPSTLYKEHIAGMSLVNEFYINSLCIEDLFMYIDFEFIIFAYLLCCALLLFFLSKFYLGDQIN
jgi:hypothetical protein